MNKTNLTGQGTVSLFESSVAFLPYNVLRVIGRRPSGSRDAVVRAINYKGTQTLSIGIGKYWSDQSARHGARSSSSSAPPVCADPICSSLLFLWRSLFKVARSFNSFRLFATCEESFVVV